jgi:prevent-host-death family protein
VRNWKLEDAKNRFSEVVRLALAHKPQRVTRGGRDAVIVLSAEVTNNS